MTSNMDPPEIAGPPLKANEDLPNTSEPLKDIQLPIDHLLLTVKDIEFLSCLSYLNSFDKYHDDNLGVVYIGNVGDERKIAVIKCDKGSSGAESSTIVVKNAVEVLRPKAVFCVGFCGGLNSQKVKLGDVVVSAKLITYAPTKVLEDDIQERGVRADVPQRILKLIKHVADGWKAPLKDRKKTDVTVHRDGVFLSGPELVDNKKRRMELVKRFSDAIAIEMEGEGLYAAAHALEVPWLIIKGVSDFADGDKTKTSNWRPFASFMAASIVANILHDHTVFRDWPHYRNKNAKPRRAPKRSSKPTAAGASSTYAELDGKRPKLNAAPTDGPARRTRLRSITQEPGVREVKVIKLINKDLERLSKKIGTDWKPLGRELEIDEPKLVKYDKENDEYDEKAYKMLLHWKQREGSAATYQVLFDALTGEMVDRKDLGEKICLSAKDSS